MSLDRWGLNDEYPDDPDYECNDCGCCFNKEIWTRCEADTCPQCGSKDIHGGGFYG